MQRYFNTSGPNIPKEHYTLMREELVKQGVKLVENNRYFTIWAPRQTGKSTYFKLLSNRLKKKGYNVGVFNFENYQDATKKLLINLVCDFINESTNSNIKSDTFSELEKSIKSVKTGKCVLIIDEIEGLNPELFNQFLHTIRNLYHFREEHCLKSVILVGVSNIIGIIEDNASPFNIADSLPVDYFTKEEVFELLAMHENETGQKFTQPVKEKIYHITAGQPGLVNGFAYKLVEDNKDKSEIDYDDYLKVEDWYLRLAIDKNIANVINKSKPYRTFLEKLLFKDVEVEFDIDRKEIRELNKLGVLKDDDGKVAFWVPLYKKRLYKSFYPYLNGEVSNFFTHKLLEDMFTEKGNINFHELIENYKGYVKRRSFRYFREKDDVTGSYKQIKEAALIYSFDTYINFFLSRIDANTYREADSGLGQTDLIVNYQGREYVFETKIYRDSFQFKKGKKQLAYYCKSLSVKLGIYLVYAENKFKTPNLIEETQNIDGVDIITYIIRYDEEKDF